MAKTWVREMYLKPGEYGYRTFIEFQRCQKKRTGAGQVVITNLNKTIPNIIFVYANPTSYKNY